MGGFCARCQKEMRPNPLKNGRKPDKKAVIFVCFFNVFTKLAV